MMDWLNSRAIGAAKTRARNRKNQAGIPSKPVAVAF